MRRRRALITGAARGIGRAIADELLADGHEVIGVDIITIDPNPSFPMLQADLGQQVDRLRLIDRVGAIDILVNNAAMLQEMSIDAFTPEEIERTLAVNFVAPFVLTQALVPGMASRGWGRIVNIASIGARTGGNTRSAPYAASKAALVALTKNTARNHGAAGVTANAVAPGAIDTEMSRSQMGVSNPALDQLVAAIPVGRLGTSAEVANVVRFLVSDGASFVTGATIDVNGGWLMP
jgi:3-oxoacyl-[acyl-carrier protein] reductase